MKRRWVVSKYTRIFSHVIARLRSHYAIGLLEGPSAIASSVHTFSRGPLVWLLSCLDNSCLQESLQDGFSYNSTVSISCALIRTILSLLELDLELF